MNNEYDMIHTYSRRQAIDDGLLVQLSGVGYQGDPKIPAACQEAGFKFPIAMTAQAFTKCVTPLEGSSETLAPGQDLQGRLWDVLNMLRYAIKRGGGDCDTVLFHLLVVPNVLDTPAGGKRHPRAKRVTLKSVCGPEDDLSPCITIMLPHED